MDKFAHQALDEYNTLTVRPGGVMGRPFWNINATQFMYAPAFGFSAVAGVKEYVFTATDSQGGEHTFTAEVPTAPLTPIWKYIAQGFVNVKVEGIGKYGEKYLLGARTFYKSEGFPGREALPKSACSYKECAIKAFDYLFNDPTTRYWLENGIPDPEYYHNVYPSKMISSIIKAMVSLAELSPEKSEDAIKLAKNAADYLISITYGEESALAGLPPTYSFKGLNKEIVDKNAPMAWGRRHQLMIIYPASAGDAYLKLEEVTKDKKYLDAAERIARYYKENVLPNGSWYLLIDEKTGMPESNNCSVGKEILEFLSKYYKRTGDKEIHTLERNYYNYITDICLKDYKWEGQFEDIKLSGNYVNLTHFTADFLISYISKNYPNDAEMMEQAREMMRFVEDQFVIWGKHAPWNEHYKNDSYWYSPAGVEQYFWYVPIDSSSAAIMNTFIDLYEATGDALLLEKAKALGDSITRMQNSESGVIPTHWMSKDCMITLENFWINCHIYTAFAMMKLARIAGEI